MSDDAVSLLRTVLAAPQLQQQLARMPLDTKTVTVIVDAEATSLSHPDWRAAASETETVDLPIESARPPGSTIAATDEGFVPLRRVGVIGHGKCPDNDYRLVGRLGSGGTGIVYQAHQRAIDREVAIKMLRDELAIDPVSRQRFLVEARVIGGLDHPNVIALHELCVDETGGLFYSMKRVDGTSWDERIDSLSLAENLETLSRVADAIRYAHSRGIIHRDIKPENVMLGRFGEVLVADWGLATSPSGDRALRSVDSTIGGTPAYMAPELAIGDPRGIGYATDVYLLGAVLFRILTGAPPHHGENLLACIHAAAHNEIRPTRVEGELIDIAMKAMSTLPSDRYDSVEGFVAALADQQQHEQSVRLVRRARKRLDADANDNNYESFRVADALLREAIEIWPENQRAHETIRQLQLDFARSAAAQGDLDLALSLYESVGENDCEAAARVRRLRDERDEQGRRESRYSALFTHSPEAGLLTRMSTGHIVEANQMFEQLLGYPKEQIVGRRISELNMWACPERRLLFIDRLKADGFIDNFEAPLFHQDGTKIAALISGRTAHIDNEDLIVSTIRDITLRKDAENELKRSRKRLCDLQRLAGLATWSYIPSRSQCEWSDETFEILGLTRDAGPPTVKLYSGLIHPEDRELFEATLSAAIDDGASYNLTLRHRMPNGSYQSLIVRGQPILDDASQTVEVYGVLLKPTSASIV